MASEKVEVRSIHMALPNRPELGRNSDSRHMAVPPLADAFRFAQNVAHALAPGRLCHQAVLRPLRQVLEVERQVVLRSEESRYRQQQQELAARRWLTSAAEEPGTHQTRADHLQMLLSYVDTMHVDDCLKL